MHISDGVLSTPVCIGGYVAALGIAAVCVRKIDKMEMPKIAVVTSVFFVASLINVPMGPTSVHLILPGLVGITLGTMAFPSVMLGLLLQAVLFGHGGLTTIGTNSIMMGFPALFTAFLFNLARKSNSRTFIIGMGALCGGLGTALAGIILAAFLMTAGEDFIGVAKTALAAHVPVLIVETMVTGFAVSFLLKVKPELIGIKNAPLDKSQN